jgi:hypothetical protein
VSAVAAAEAAAEDEACCLGIVVVVVDGIDISIFMFLSYFGFDFPSREIETTIVTIIDNSENKIFHQVKEIDESDTMGRIYGKLSVYGPTAVNRYRQRHGEGSGGIGCDVVITRSVSDRNKQSCVTGVPSAPSAPSAPVADNIMKPPQMPQVPQVPIVVPPKPMDIRSTNTKLGKLIYTTKAGDTFTAYHSAVFPKIVNEVDKIVYDNKESWYAAMRVAAPFRCD